jgi:AcrR family transcriptional regulator
MTKPGERTPAANRTRAAKTNARGARSREAILSTAARYFAEHGYRGTSTAVIARAAQISEPGLLHHFGTKNGLLKALLEMRYALDESKFRVEARFNGLQLLPLLEALVRENVQQREGVKLTMVILAESILPSHPAHGYFKRRYQRAREILSAHLQRAQDRKMLRRNVDVAALASTLLATMDGLQLQWLLDPRIDMAACYAGFSHILERALREPRKA